MIPNYPIFIPSRGRFDRSLSLTANLLDASRVHFFLVVEPQEQESYERAFGAHRILVLPFRDRGHVAPARNWIKQHSLSQGDRRHWQIDDNVKIIKRYDGKKGRAAEPGAALRSCEDFVDRYSNIAIAGLRNGAYVWTSDSPFAINQQTYCCVLVDNLIPIEWRGIAEDTDYSLQVLTMGYCTVLFNAFFFEKPKRMTMKGGNTDTVYAKNGLLEQALDLQRRWPQDVKIVKRYGEDRMSLGHTWRRFKQQLQREKRHPHWITQ